MKVLKLILILTNVILVSILAACHAEDEFEFFETAEYAFLTATLGEPLGMVGFEGEFALNFEENPTINEEGMVEIIVQFHTPPFVALELAEELRQGREIGTRRARRERETRNNRSGRNRLRDEAQASHDDFAEQLDNQLLGEFSEYVEIISSHFYLFNGVYLRVSPELVTTIAELPEVYAVFPMYVFEPMALEEESANQTDTTTTFERTSTNDWFIDPDFMRIPREYLQIDYINDVMGITGAGVRVGVIDTGIDHDHPEFQRFLDDTGRIRGWESHNNTFSDNPAHTGRNHGTAVSGAVIGIAPNVYLWNYRIILASAPGGMTATGGIEQAWRDEMDVINMSFGNDFNHPFHPLVNTVNLVVLDGVVAIGSAGNSGTGNTAYSLSAPATSPLVITVGAGRHGGNQAIQGDSLRNYSSRGPTPITQHLVLDLIAPSGVRTTNINDGYMIASGTSLASPIIAGVAALILEKYPNATPAEVRARLMTTARTMELLPENGVPGTGAGFVQPLAALTSPIIANAFHDVPLTASRYDAWSMQPTASFSFGAVLYDGFMSQGNTITGSVTNVSDFTKTIHIVATQETTATNPSKAIDFVVDQTSFTLAPGEVSYFDVTVVVLSQPAGRFYHGKISFYNDETGESLGFLPALTVYQPFLHVAFNPNGGVWTRPNVHTQNLLRLKNITDTDFSTVLNVNNSDLRSTDQLAPIKEGYVFSGWYTDLVEGTRINHNTPILELESSTLYARWRPLETIEAANECRQEGLQSNVFTDSTGISWCIVETQEHEGNLYSLLVSRHVLTAEDLGIEGDNRIHYEDIFVPWPETTAGTEGGMESRVRINEWFTTQASPFLRMNAVDATIPELYLSTPIPNSLGAIMPVFFLNDREISDFLGQNVNLARITFGVGTHVALRYPLRRSGILPQWSATVSSTGLVDRTHNFTGIANRGFRPTLWIRGDGYQAFHIPTAPRPRPLSD